MFPGSNQRKMEHPDNTLTDRQILDRLKSIPRQQYASRDELYKIWFSDKRPKTVKFSKDGGEFVINNWDKLLLSICK